jgi:hypothetical protein
MSTPNDDLRIYLETGKYDQLAHGWPGRNIWDQWAARSAAMREALIARVAPHVERQPKSNLAAELHIEARRRIAPMVRALFVEQEQDVVLDAISTGFVLISADTIIPLLQDETDMKTAWRLAMMFIKGACALEIKGEDVDAVGMNDGLASYIIADEVFPSAPFMDVIVHEAAHAFHNCKRARLGLAATRYREWLLNIAYGKRETFAYACEAYSRIVADAHSVRDRRAYLEELKRSPPPPDDRVDYTEYLHIMAHAIEGRNGWRRILTACAPAPRRAVAV